MAGLPPFAGFYGKMFIWASLLEDIYLFSDFLSFVLLLVNLVVSLIIIFYYMRLVILVFLGAEATSCVTLPYYFTLMQLNLLSTSADFTSKSSEIYFVQYLVVFMLVF